jgi:hypothetical protein
LRHYSNRRQLSRHPRHSHHRELYSIRTEPDIQKALSSLPAFANSVHADEPTKELDNDTFPQSLKPSDLQGVIVKLNATVKEVAIPSTAPWRNRTACQTSEA